MAEAQFSAVTISGDHVVINGSETMVFVHLGTVEILVTLPPAVPGRLIIVGIADYTSPVGTTSRVRIIPDPMTPADKINGNPESELWVVHDRTFFCGQNAGGWSAF